MRLVPVKASVTPFVALCLECGKRIQSDRDPIIADLDGPAFQAYYCAPCAEKLSEDAP